MKLCCRSRDKFLKARRKLGMSSVNVAFEHENYLDADAGDQRINNARGTRPNLKETKVISLSNVDKDRKMTFNRRK